MLSGCLARALDLGLNNRPPHVPVDPVKAHRQETEPQIYHIWGLRGECYTKSHKTTIRNPALAEISVSHDRAATVFSS